MIVIDGDAPEILELAFRAELGHEKTTIITRECLHPTVVAIDNEQETSIMVEHQASRRVELAISSASSLGADRELDSSITVKSIVSHLFHFNLSHSQRQRDVPNSKLCKPRDDGDMKLSHTRRERDTKQASNEQQEATRSNR